MLKIAYILAIGCSNRAHSDLDKLMEPVFFIRSSEAAAWYRSRWARHGAFAGRRIAGVSIGTLTGTGRRLGGSSAGRAPMPQHHSPQVLRVVDHIQ